MRDLACPQTSLVCCREVPLPPRRLAAGTADGLRSNLVSGSSQQMLGTIRINGLETQVRAIRTLHHYSPNCALRRKRFIEAESWKTGKETAIAFIPGAGEEIQEEGVCTEEAVVCLRQRSLAWKWSYSQGLFHWFRSLGQPLSKPQPSGWGF